MVKSSVNQLREVLLDPLGMEGGRSRSLSWEDDDDPRKGERELGAVL